MDEPREKERLLKKRESFHLNRVARFVVTDHFKEDCLSFLLNKKFKKQYLYAVYEHEDNFNCGSWSKCVLKHWSLLNLKVTMSHKHYLIWYKENPNWKRITHVILFYMDRMVIWVLGVCWRVWIIVRLWEKQIMGMN